jgi:hypothetical protein
VVIVHVRKSPSASLWGRGVGRDPQHSNLVVERQHLTDPLLDADAVCRTVCPQHRGGGQWACRSGKRFE